MAKDRGREHCERKKTKNRFDTMDKAILNNGYHEYGISPGCSLCVL